MEAWESLTERASANVFMHPIALNAAHAADFATIEVLLAWDESAAPKRLVGLWALQRTQIPPLWMGMLAAPPYDYAFLSNPVIDPAFGDNVLPAFFDAIGKHPALPKVIRLKYLDADCDSYPAMLDGIRRSGRHSLQLSERARPFASKQSGLKQSGSTRKKLRQDWNRLSALGAVQIGNGTTQDAVRDAFEIFLALEAGSWKGAGGTALLCNAEDVRFVRGLITDLAANCNASVALLSVDGRAIAAQVLLYCGRTAYTWKTAFDQEYAKYSPGAVLVEKLTEQLFSGGNVDVIESCSPDGSFMGQLWTGRRSTVDLLIDVGRAKSPSFIMAALGERGYLRLRDLRDKIRSFSASKKRVPAVPRPHAG
jgi:CelD/BcsL family acetyltransferase involved in cellulose biosynthesis